jgi:L-fuconolactonase
MKVDAHFHAWHLARGDYGWLTPALAPIHRDVEVADWAEQAAACGIHAGLLVQAAPTAAETTFLLKQARAHPQRVQGVIGWVDLLAADAASQVYALAREPLLKGLRPMLQDIADTDWIEQPAAQPALAAMAETRLVFDALIQPRHLGVIARLAQRHRQLRIVVDHGAKPAMDGPVDQPPGRAWRQGLAQLAACTDAQQVMCKLSGLWTEAPRGQPCEHVRPWAQILLEVWGPDRLIWGSDWPVLELAGDYRSWYRFSLELLAGLSADQQAAVLGGNARALYQL